MYMRRELKPEEHEEILRAIKNLKDCCLIIDADGKLVKDEDGDAPQLFICDNEEKDQFMETIDWTSEFNELTEAVKEVEAKHKSEECSA